MKRKYSLFLSLLAGLLVFTCLTLSIKVIAARANPESPQAQVISRGLAYLQSQQQADGGMVGFSGVSDADTTARSVMAFISTGQRVNEIVASSGNTMLDYLSAQAITFTHDITGNLFPGRAGLLLTAISMAGENPTQFGGMDVIAELEASFHPETGVYSTTAQQDFSSGQASDTSQAWALLGLSLAGEITPDEASQYLVDVQAEDGSWGFGDPDTTALAVTALLANGKMNGEEQAVQNALQYFRVTQLPSGGWRPSWDTDPLNADSTGWILQALISAGEDPSGEGWMAEQGSPVQSLMDLQKPDGSIGGTYANTYSTAEALIGLSGVPLSKILAPPVSHQAGLAVFSSEGAVYTACISFDEEAITSLDLLQRSGLSIESATNPSQGTAVCSIEAVGCPPNDCFCNMPDYWSFWQGSDEGWVYSALGSEQSQVMDGDVNAWSWGTGNPPVDISYQNICEGVPFVIPTATVTSIPPTDTPSPTQTTPAEQAAEPSQPPQAAGESQISAGTYLVYASILVVISLIVFFLVRSRRKS
jgi:hypothetical protein